MLHGMLRSLSLFLLPSQIPTPLSTGSARDRWFDKSFQLIVSQDGEAAINFEHAWGDGIAVVRFANEVHDFVSSPAFEFVGIEEKEESSYNENYRRLKWDLDADSVNAISDAAKRADDLISTIDYAVVQSDAINSSWAKSNKLSPDGLLQMIMQLAHYRLKGRAGSTYESATTAAFKHGRRCDFSSFRLSISLFSVAIS